MKRLIYSMDDIFGMADINPKRSGLNVVIWSDHGGVSRNVPHNEPRIKIGTDDYSIVVTIEATPKELAKSGKPKKSEEKDLQEGVEYVGRNYDLFLRHYNDTDFSFDDEDLFNELRSRGEYK